MASPALNVAARELAGEQCREPEQDLTGRTLLHYQVEEKIGAGGMGVVYRARDTHLGRSVAIKLLPEVFTGDRERMARFEREARLLALLNHPNVAAIHSIEKIDNQRFLVLELVEGKTLAQRITKGRLPMEEALEICRQIAEGLEAAHEKAIIHRDSKPVPTKNLIWRSLTVWSGFGMHKSSEVMWNSAAMGKGRRPSCRRRRTRRII